MNKICVSCNIEKNYDHYRKFKSKNKKEYRRNICIKCEKLNRREYFKIYYRKRHTFKSNKPKNDDDLFRKTICIYI